MTPSHNAQHISCRRHSIQSLSEHGPWRGIHLPGFHTLQGPCFVKEEKITRHNPPKTHRSELCCHEPRESGVPASGPCRISASVFPRPSKRSQASWVSGLGQRLYLTRLSKRCTGGLPSAVLCPSVFFSPEYPTKNTFPHKLDKTDTFSVWEGEEAQGKGGFK